MNSPFMKKVNRDNKGMTLVEMVVSFALLGILVAASTVIISNVTMLYYRVRGENYARQISNIVITKVTSEIAGAKIDNKNTAANPKILKSVDGVDDISGNAVRLFDRTDTEVVIYVKDGVLVINYPKIRDEENPDNNRVSTDWKYDKSIYNGFSIKELYIVQAATADNEEIAARYGVTGVVQNNYPDNIVAVYMTLDSPKYGEFKVYRYIKIYEAPETDFEIDIIE